MLPASFSPAALHEAAEEAGGEAGHERKPKKVEAEARTERVGGQVVGQEGDEGTHGGRRERDAKHTAGHREEEAIGEQLTADPASGSAESESCANLAAPCRAAGEKEAGNIQAGEAEQNASGGEKEPQRLG